MVFKKAKLKAADFFLRKLANEKKRKPIAVGIDQAKSIGIIFDASEKENLEIIKKYVSSLKEEKKKVQVLGYYNLKELPFELNSKLDYDYFSKKDVNWHLKPNNAVITNFANEPFDILLNLTTDIVLPIQYVFVMSKANFKIGRASAKHLPFYDLSIEAKEESGLKQLIDIFTKYLKMIHSKNQQSLI
jgi:hypothetical protein